MKWIWVSVLGAMAAGGLYPALACAAEPSSPTDQSAFDAILLEANRRFVEGDLEGALRALEPACGQSDRAECSFSLGAIQHGLGHCAEALGHYRHYRQIAPGGEHIAEVTAALEEVESRCGEDNVSMAPAAPAALGTLPSDTGLPSSLDPPHAASVSAPQPPLVAPPSGSSHTPLVAGSLVLSGAAAATSVVFGILAAQTASHCAHAQAYDQSYIDECEVQGPRYQRLWQGFALAAGGFLGIGVTIWWFDANSEASLGVSRAGNPTLQFQRSF